MGIGRCQWGDFNTTLCQDMTLITLLVNKLCYWHFLLITASCRAKSDLLSLFHSLQSHWVAWPGTVLAAVWSLRWRRYQCDHRQSTEHPVTGGVRGVTGGNTNTTAGLSLVLSQPAHTHQSVFSSLLSSSSSLLRCSPKIVSQLVGRIFLEASTDIIDDNLEVRVG